MALGNSTNLTVSPGALELGCLGLSLLASPPTCNVIFSKLHGPSLSQVGIIVLPASGMVVRLNERNKTWGVNAETGTW